MKELKKAVTILAQEELKRANEKFPMFHSWHESYAVLKEEIEEAQEDIEQIKHKLDNYWEQIKGNFAHYGEVEVLQNYAISLACEAIQIVSMCEKTKASDLLDLQAKDVL